MAFNKLRIPSSAQIAFARLKDVTLDLSRNHPADLILPVGNRCDFVAAGVSDFVSAAQKSETERKRSSNENHYHHKPLMFRPHHF